MLQLKNLTVYKKCDDTVLLPPLSFTLTRGDKIAVIGEEGNGKSTLLRYLYDRKDIDAYAYGTGEAVCRGTVGYLVQNMSLVQAEQSVQEFLDDVSVYERYAFAERLGIADLLFGPRKMKELSGGERIKLRLFRLAAQEADVLLLDEPSNDLDIDALATVCDFIVQCACPVLFVSHDETLIRRAANGILHIEQLGGKKEGKVTFARVPYDEYLQRRDLQFDRQTRIAQKERSEYRKKKERLQRLYEKAQHNDSWKGSDGLPSSDGHARKHLQSVVALGKRFERQKEDFAAVPRREESIITRFDADVALPAQKRVAELCLPTLTAGDRVLAENVHLTVTGNAHIGIVGKNGAGKSTLLRTLWRSLRDRTDITMGYMPQNYAEVYDFSLSPVEYLQAHYDKAAMLRAQTFLGNMRFTPQEMSRPIGALSGGQQAKILFLDMVLRRANVLLLDEPTRNFSPLSAPVVRSALACFGGAIVAVSHDRLFLEEVTDTVYELTPEGLYLR